MPRCARSSATCLLQVLFHARGRLAEEERSTASGSSFDIDDVAADLVAKLVGRHPHVFAGSDVRARERIDTAERQEHRWEELKRAEKQRDSSVDGVPLGQPAVALAAKLISRTARAGLPADLLPDGAGLGERLFADAARAKLAGDDPEAALRIAARRFADDVRAAERSARDAGLDPHALDADAWRAHWPRTDSPCRRRHHPVRRACGCRARTCCRAAARSPRRRSSRSSPRAGSRGARP